MKPLEKIIAAGKNVIVSVALAACASSHIPPIYSQIPQQREQQAYAVITKILTKNCNNVSITKNRFHCERKYLDNAVCEFAWDEIERVIFFPQQPGYVISVVQVQGPYDFCNIGPYGNDNGQDLAQAMKIYIRERRRNQSTLSQ